MSMPEIKPCPFCGGTPTEEEAFSGYNKDKWWSLKCGCGQIDMHAWDIAEYAPGWTAELVATLRDVWQRWHLNDMRAGSAAQEEWLRAHPLDPASYAYPKSHFEVAREALRAAGLQPDPDGYSYGSAWKFEAVPAGVLDFLRSLPDTDQHPAWV